MIRVIILVGFLGLILACEKEDVPIDIPKCIEEIIDGMAKTGVIDPSARVYRYNYNGQFVYYLPPRCCDMYSLLYDEDCNIICYPDGGHTGGDGRCSDFLNSRTDEILIWEGG